MIKMNYILDKQQLFDFLKGITNPGLKKRNMLDKINIPKLNKTVNLEYYVWMVWNQLLKDKDITGTAIDQHEWCKYFQEVTDDMQLVTRLFKQINVKSKCINYPEFLQYILFLDDTDLQLFKSCINPLTISNPLVDIDLNDSVMIEIKDSTTTTTSTTTIPTSNNSKPDNLEKNKSDSQLSGHSEPQIDETFVYEKEHSKQKSFCEKCSNIAVLLWLDLKLLVLNFKNKIMNNLYGIS